MADFVEIARGFYLEGLLVDGDDIWLTDVIEGGVRNLATGQVVLPDRTMIGGLLLNKDGRLLVAGIGGIEWVDPATGASGTVVSGVPGVNEMRSDGQGGILFGTIDLPSVLAGKRPAPSEIRRLAHDGTQSVLASGFTFANGLSLNPTGTRLYFNESFSGVRSFGIDADWRLGAMDTFGDMPDCDGMALDAAGNMWVSGFSSGFLVCFDPHGGEVARIDLPGKACTNLRFGGPDFADLYVTVVDTAAAQRLARGEPLTERSSVLYKTRAPVPGAPIDRAGLQLA